MILKKILLFSLCLMGLSSAASAQNRDRNRNLSPIFYRNVPVGFKPNGFCTRDLNEWGNPSRCGCKPKFKYDSRSGRCFQNRVKYRKHALNGQIEVSGRQVVLRTPYYSLPLKTRRQSLQTLRSIDGQYIDARVFFYREQGDRQSQALLLDYQISSEQ